MLKSKLLIVMLFILFLVGNILVFISCFIDFRSFIICVIGFYIMIFSVNLKNKKILKEKFNNDGD